MMRLRAHQTTATFAGLAVVAVLQPVTVQAGPKISVGGKRTRSQLVCLGQIVPLARDALTRLYLLLLGCTYSYSAVPIFYSAVHRRQREAKQSCRTTANNAVTPSGILEKPPTSIRNDNANHFGYNRCCDRQPYGQMYV